MTFSEIKALEPELGRLERSAQYAGSLKATWWSTWLAMTEPLSKLVGRCAIDERLQSDVCYAAARLAIYRAWSRGADSLSAKTPDKLNDEPKQDTRGAAPIDMAGQRAFFDVTEQYR